MSDWLRWPRLWYATPTFVLFIALQAPDWRFTSRVAVALSVWAMAGIAIDVWMTRRQQRPGSPDQAQRIRRLINWSVILGFVVGFPAGLYARAFWPTTDSVGAATTGLNNALDGIGILLPALDIFHRKLIEMNRLDYAAYLGSFFVLTVVMWLAGFFLFYRALADMPSTEFAKVIEELSIFGKPPYGAQKRQLAWLRLMGMTAMLAVFLFLFGRVLPTTSYVTLAFAGPGVNMLIYVIHRYRRLLSTLQPDGFLPAGNGGSRDHV